VPPAAMTVLAFNAIGTSFKDNPHDGLLVLAASVFTSLLHLWKRNFLVSILGGTILFMILGL
jgi:branched-subunit amino acid transport protein AzlD